MVSRITFTITTLVLLLTACTTPGNTPPEAIEAYLTALVAKDETQAVTLSCAAWESQALVEGDAFEGVEVTLQNPACQTTEENNDTATVACTGAIVFSYAGGENQELDLSLRTYVVAYENDEWKMCGYQ